MLRQNRYKHNDFIHSLQELAFIQEEILISKEHDIVIYLEPYQVEKFEDLQEFIMGIIKAIPKLDNETQDYYETISDSSDFPHSLAIVYLNGHEIRFEYWSDDVNNQFDIAFYFENDAWILKRWNAIEVPLDWRNSNNK